MHPHIPADVSPDKRLAYATMMDRVTYGTGRLFLFAGDQKVEHLHRDFAGPGIDPADGSPEHLFRIAGSAKIGVFAAHLGLISQYGVDHPHVPYLVKMNGKTDIIPTTIKDPHSRDWYDLDQVERFARQSGLLIAGVGYTIYPGSLYEPEMLAAAASLVTEAHARGLMTVIWCYPRGTSVKDEHDPTLIAGMTGLVACMGSDYVKVNPPVAKTSPEAARKLHEAVVAAGRTGVICAGGASTSESDYLKTLTDQLKISGVRGCAVGRNVHQKPLTEAVALCDKIHDLICR